MSSMEYTARDLRDVADFFDVLASDQLACVRFQSTAKAKRECEIRASTWTDAANVLRQTRLTGDA